MHAGGFSGSLGSKTLPQTPPNHDFGTILDVFWTDFGRIFGIILEVFFMKNAVLPAWELIFQKFRRISWFVGKGTAPQGKKAKGTVAPASIEIQSL